MTEAKKPQITIAYCTQCQWLLRAAWMAQELLSTFGTDLGGVTLAPSTGGHFEITYDGETLWERKADGGFPEAKILIADAVLGDRAKSDERGGFITSGS